MLIGRRTASTATYRSAQRCISVFANATGKWVGAVRTIAGCEWLFVHTDDSISGGVDGGNPHAIESGNQFESGAPMVVSVDDDKTT